MLREELKISKAGQVEVDHCGTQPHDYPRQFFRQRGLCKTQRQGRPTMSEERSGLNEDFPKEVLQSINSDGSPCLQKGFQVKHCILGFLLRVKGSICVLA
jgi:hypothetical protein